MGDKQIRIQQLIYDAKNGNIEAKEEITKYYIKQIDRLIENKYNKENLDKEELKQAGYLGLAIALKKYDEDINGYFSIYVNGYIRSYISKEIKNQSKETINVEIENTYNDFISYIENKEFIWIAINKLSDKYRKILFLYLYEGYSFVEIAKIYNLSTERIRQIYKRSLEIIKEELIIQNEDKKNKKTVKKYIIY